VTVPRENRFLINLIAVAISLGAYALEAKPLTGRVDVAYAALPAAGEGRFPVQLPEYRGQVRQLLWIDNRRLILAVYDVPEMVARMDALADGALLRAVRTFRESEAAGRPDWTAFRVPGQIHDRFLAQAREELGERSLDQIDSYAISGEADAHYRTARHPARVTRTFVSLGAGRSDGAHQVDYAHYCLLEMTAPLRDGQHYTITVGTRGSVAFDYDERRTVSRAIKVNQAGYLPDAGAKFAYLGAFGYAFGPLEFPQAETFSVIDAATGATVLTGPVRLRERDPRFATHDKAPDPASRPSMYGEHVYELDLGGLHAQGTFFITIPGVGRSWSFRHAPDAYGETFYIAARGLFHQRAATALEARHTAWTRPKSLMHDTIYEADHIAFPPHLAETPNGYQIFDVYGASTDRNRVTQGVIGGWYDAADWDRNQSHFSVVFSLLNAYEFAPQAFADGQLKLPESGNGVPDLLDEVRWGLECWRRSQDARGGISGFIETNTHPGYDDPKHPYAFSRRTRWSSLIYAAAAAQYARLVRPFDAASAALYATSAQRAWAFGIAPTNSLGKVEIPAKRNRGQGNAYMLTWEEQESHILPYRVHAAMQLFRLTRDAALLERIGEYARQAHPPFAWRFSHRDFSVWVAADLALDPEGVLPDDVKNHWRAFYLREADTLLAQLAVMPYRQTWPRHQDFWAGWGASDVANFNRCLALAWRLTGERRYRDAIINNMDFMLGANPMGMSWTTGIGYVYPIDIQHAMSEDDGIMDPVPGITLYGLDGGPAMHHRGRELVWESKGPDGKPVAFLSAANREVPFYRRWSAHPHVNTAQCEFTIHETMASTVFTAALLLPPGWMPDEALRARGPRRDDLLFGYWPLP
jgi:endoglucanase